LRATTEPAGIINNDAPAPVGNIADNNDDDEQLIDAANVENVGNPGNNNDRPDVVDELLIDAAQKVLTEFMKSAAILFYEHNENDETQEDVDADADSSSSSSTVSSSSSKQRQNKSTNQTAQAASIDMQTENNSSNNPAPPKSQWCDWAKDSFSHRGLDTPHQERCIVDGLPMMTCTHIGCSKMVHLLAMSIG
jgi:hypothetical protein